MLGERFDRVVNFRLTADLVYKERFVRLQIAPDDRMGNGRVRIAQALGNHPHVIVEAGSAMNHATLNRGANQVESDFVKIHGELFRLGFAADFVAQHSDVAAEWRRPDCIVGLAAAVAEYFWWIADRESQHADADFLRHREVSRLVYDYQHGEHQCCR